MQIDRHKFINGLLEEQKLRAVIKKGIAIILEKRKKYAQQLQEEQQVRTVVRHMIKEAKKANIKLHKSTGMNALEILVTSTNFLDAIKGEYAKLTTDASQRESFKQHIMNAIENMFARDELNREPDEEEQEQEAAKPESNLAVAAGDDLEQEDDIGVQIAEALANLKEQTETRDERGISSFAVMSELDRTGAIAAKRAWNIVDELIRTELSGLPNEEDRQTFKQYLLWNFEGKEDPQTGEWLPGYFEQWEEEISGIPDRA